MISKYLMLMIALLAVQLTGTARAVDAQKEPNPTNPKSVDTNNVVSADSAHYVVYYFYTNVRCATCRKLESYSQEAVDSGFAGLIADHRLEFRGVNTDDEQNTHFLKDYGLYTKSVVIVEYHGDAQARWKNLEKIWELVGDKPKYLAYLREEINSFMNKASE